MSYLFRLLFLWCLVLRQSFPERVLGAVSHTLCWWTGLKLMLLLDAGQGARDELVSWFVNGRTRPLPLLQLSVSPLQPDFLVQRGQQLMHRLTKQTKNRFQPSVSMFSLCLCGFTSNPPSHTVINKAGATDRTRTVLACPFTRLYRASASPKRFPKVSFHDRKTKYFFILMFYWLVLTG